MVWPPLSPDLSIMGVRLGLHEETEAAEKLKSTEEIWEVLQNVWNNQPAKYLEKLALYLKCPDFTFSA